MTLTATLLCVTILLFILAIFAKTTKHYGSIWKGAFYWFLWAYIIFGIVIGLLTFPDGSWTIGLWIVGVIFLAYVAEKKKIV